MLNVSGTRANRITATWIFRLREVRSMTTRPFGLRSRKMKLPSVRMGRAEEEPIWEVL